MSSVNFSDCSKEMSCCIVARIQRLPSSRAGMNSPPTSRNSNTAATRDARAIAQVSLLKRSARLSAPS